MGKASLDLPDELEEEIENQLSYGDSKAEWIRQAIRIRQTVDPVLDEIYENHQRQKREELIAYAVRKEVDRRKREIDNGSNH